MDWNIYCSEIENPQIDYFQTDLSKVDWHKIDDTFSPKRKVKNTFAGKFPHMIGSFFSEKNKRNVEYESLSENYAFSLFELDPQVVRYYVQPIEIQVPYIDKNGIKKAWNHHPDVLVFRQGSCPHLFQIKNTKELILNQKHEVIDKTCLRYAYSQGWMYYTVHPKEMSETVLTNIKFLSGFLKKRNGYDSIIPELINKIESDNILNIAELVQKSNLGVDSYQLLPAVYHLIAINTFYFDLA